MHSSLLYPLFFQLVTGIENERPYYAPIEVVAKPLLISRGTRQRLKIDLVPECLNLNIQVLNTLGQSIELGSIF